ncbi:MAG: Rab family GTPase [Promethearchaeota archaeon]|jgi:small GTP-binding protein
MKFISKLSKFWSKKVSRRRRKLVFKPQFSYDETFKVMLLGEPGAGRSTLAQKYCFDFVNPSLGESVGVDFYTKSLDFQGRNIKLQIWDIGGEERFSFLLPTYCIGASAVMIIYDITDPQSLKQLYNWIQVIREKIYDVPIMLIGNKLDLEECRKLEKDEAIEIVKKYKLACYSEISIKTGENVEKSFEALTEILINEPMV